jgi:DNA-binding IclR family transcriptional regulator
MRAPADVASPSLPTSSKLTRGGRGGQVQSVARALDLLEALAASDESGLVEVAERAGLLPSTAHRLLATLAARGYVFRNPATGRYLLSYKVLELGSQVQRRTAHLRAVARPYLERVRKVCGETVNLVVLDDDAEIVYVDQLEGLHAMRMFMHTGRKFPAYTAAAGKALLAHWADERIAERYREQRFEALTPRTITSLTELLRDVERTRRRGFALDDEEHETGVTCVAAAVIDHVGSAAAAISVSGPSQRLRSTGLSELGDLLTIIAAELSAELGHSAEAGGADSAG